jgi:hypothetical protein
MIFIKENGSFIPSYICNILKKRTAYQGMYIAVDVFVFFSTGLRSIY